MANIQKRGETYRIRVYIGEDSKGKKIYKSKTYKPEPGLSDRQIEKELNKTALAFEQSILSGNIAETTKVRFDDFCTDYLAIIKPTYSPTTYSYYVSIIERELKPFFGFMKLKDIKPIHCQRFIQYLQEPREGKNSEKIVLSASSIQRYFTVLKSIISKAYKLGYIDTNPTDTARLEMPKVIAPDIDCYSVEEAEEMLKLLEDEPLMFRLLIHLAIVTGARRGELVGLQWSCIDFKNKTIDIKQSLCKVKGEDIQLKTTKTQSSIRTVAVPDYIVEMLKQFQKLQKAERLRLGTLWNDSGFIFTQWDGKPMFPSTPTLWFDRFQKKHNLKHHKFHSLRHTSATLLLTSGTNIKTVSARLGHTQLSTTNRYLHNLKSADEEAGNTFQGMFNKSEDIPKAINK